MDYDACHKPRIERLAPLLLVARKWQEFSKFLQTNQTRISSYDWKGNLWKSLLSPTNRVTTDVTSVKRYPMYIGQLHWSYAMEETTDTAATELAANLQEEQQLSDSMDGPSLSQNQETSSAMEEIIDNDDGDIDTEDNAETGNEGQA